MSLSRKRVLTLAVLLGAVTTFMVYLLLTRQRVNAQSAEAPEVKATEEAYAVVPREGIRPLQLLNAEMFRVKKVARQELPGNAVLTVAELQDKVSLVPLPADAPVERNQVANRGPELGMAYAVRPPRRAVTVALDPIIGVAGFPKPGNHVDVLATFTTDRGMVTRTVLQDVEILALGAEIQPVSKDKKAEKQAEAAQQPTATLAVLPAEAEKLILAESRGKLRLALRSVDDETVRGGPGMKEIQVTGVPPKEDKDRRPAPAPAPAPAAKVREVAPAPAPTPALASAAPASVAPVDRNLRDIEVVRGTTKQTVKVKADDSNTPVDPRDLR